MKRYGLLRFLFNYVSFRFKAQGKHYVHSPFVFQMFEKVFASRSEQKHPDIERARKALKSNKNKIEVTDYGKDGQKFNRSISSIALSSLKPQTFAEMLGRLCAHFKVNTALEMGTSLGITSAYIARNIQGQLHSLEGDQNVLKIAEGIWNDLNIQNIRSYPGEFDQNLNPVLSQIDKLDLVFIDGNHRKEPTLAYFKRLLSHAHNDTVFVFDDIHWSPGMEEAWKIIQDHAEVTCTVDLYFLGLVFIRKEMRKEHFKIRI